MATIELSKEEVQAAIVALTKEHNVHLTRWHQLKNQSAEASTANLHFGKAQELASILRRLHKTKVAP